MPQNRILYNVQDLYVGPPNDQNAILLNNKHVLQRLYRIQSFDYSIDINRKNDKELGKKSIISNIVGSPEVSFSFDYLLGGVANESKVGLNVNWNLTGQNPIYTNPSGTCLISGFLDPSRLYDKRNFYVAINQSGQDAHSYSYAKFITGASGWNENDLIDSNSQNYHILSFVDSYLTNLSYDMSVGDFPSARLNYVANNAVYFLSGSGFPIPLINPLSPTGLFSNFKGVIPKHYYDGYPSALRPGDVIFSLSSTGHGSLIKDWGLRVTDAKIQNFSMNLPLQREKLQFIGNHYPVDRPILFPIKANINLNFIVGDAISTYETSGVSPDVYLNSSDAQWYALRLTNKGFYTFKIDQSPSSNVGSDYYWVLNCADDGLNYKVGLTTNNNITSLYVEQASTGTLGDSYKDIAADDNTLHRVTLYSGAGRGFVGLSIDQDSLGSAGIDLLSSSRIESLDYLKFQDYDYNASIRVRNPNLTYFDGQQTALAIDIKKANIESFSFSSNINNQKIANVSLSTEINPDDLSKGIFISGILPSLSTSSDNNNLINSIIVLYELITEDDIDLITTEDSEVLNAESIQYTPSVF